MNFKSKIKRKIGLALAGAAVVAGGVVGSSVPASALTGSSYDCMPAPNTGTSFSDCDIQPRDGSYVSQALKSGSATLEGGRASGWIYWANSSGLITVDTVVEDTWSNGRGPMTQARLMSGSTEVARHTFNHNTNGLSTVTQASTQFQVAGSVDSTDGIQVRVCDGLDSNGNADNCGAWHGSFHG